MLNQYQSIFRKDLFKDQFVLMTGGGSGIGRCTAHELVALGAKIALVGRSLEKLEKVKDELSDVGGESECFTCDIRKENDVKQMVTNVLTRFQRIDHPLIMPGDNFQLR